MTSTYNLMDTIKVAENDIQNGSRYALCNAGYWIAQWDQAVRRDRECKKALVELNHWLENHGERTTDSWADAILRVQFVLTDIFYDTIKLK